MTTAGGWKITVRKIVQPLDDTDYYQLFAISETHRNLLKELLDTGFDPTDSLPGSYPPNPFMPSSLPVSEASDTSSSQCSTRAKASSEGKVEDILQQSPDIPAVPTGALMRSQARALQQQQSQQNLVSASTPPATQSNTRHQIHPNLPPISQSAPPVPPNPIAQTSASVPTTTVPITTAIPALPAQPLLPAQYNQPKLQPHYRYHKECHSTTSYNAASTPHQALMMHTQKTLHTISMT